MRNISGVVEAFKILIESGADVNAGDYLNLTPLHISAKHGNFSANELIFRKSFHYLLFLSTFVVCFGQRGKSKIEFTSVQCY